MAKPLRDATRYRIKPVGAPIPFVENSIVQFELPRTGMLSRIWLQLKGTYRRDVGSLGLNKNDRLWNILRRINVNLNTGATNIVDISGYGLQTVNGTRFPNFESDSGGSAPTPLASAQPIVNNGTLFMDPEIFFFDATKGIPGAPEDVPLALLYEIPIALNQADYFDYGLINLESVRTRVMCVIQTGFINDLYGAPLGFPQPVTNLLFQNLTLECHYEYIDLPAPGVDPPPACLHILQEERIPFNNPGDIVYQVPRQGTLLRYFANMMIDGYNARFDGTLTVRINKTDDIYNIKNNVLAQLYRERYGHTANVGTHVLDLWNTGGTPAIGDFRDAINTESIATLEMITNLSTNPAHSSDTTVLPLGFNNNFVDNIRELIVPYS